MNSSYYDSSSISSNIDGLLNESDLDEFIRSEVSTDINGILSPRQFYRIFDEQKSEYHKPKNTRTNYGNGYDERDTTFNRFQKKSKDENMYLNQYLNWKQSQPITFKLPQNIKITQIKPDKQEKDLQENILCKIKQLEQQRVKYYNYDSEVSQKKQEKNTKKIITKQKWIVQKIEPVIIQNTKIQKASAIQTSTNTENIEQELKKLKKNQEKLTRNYQSFIECPPKRQSIPKSEPIKLERSNIMIPDKQLFSSSKSPVFDINHFQLYLKTPTQSPKMKPSQTKHLPQKRKSSIKKQDMQKFLKSTLQNAGQKTIQQLSQQHKSKVYDFLYR